MDRIDEWKELLNLLAMPKHMLSQHEKEREKQLKIKFGMIPKKKKLRKVV